MLLLVGLPHLRRRSINQADFKKSSKGKQPYMSCFVIYVKYISECIIKDKFSRGFTLNNKTVETTLIFA